VVAKSRNDIATDLPIDCPTCHTPMNSTINIDERLTNLEIKASFTDDLLDKLDQVIIRQQDQIDRLTQEVLRLSQPAPNQDNAPPRNPRDELPPHY